MLIDLKHFSSLNILNLFSVVHFPNTLLAWSYSFQIKEKNFYNNQNKTHTQTCLLEYLYCRLYIV